MAKAAQSPLIKSWRVPDPRDPSAYPKATSSTPMPQWGWEFLRRHPDFRSAWWKKLRPYLNDQQDNFDQETIERHYEADRSEALRECRRFRWSHPSIALRDEFRVSGESVFCCNITCDPRLARPPLFDGTYINEVLFDGTYINEVRQHSDLVKRPKVLLEFDVELPRDLQLENAGEVLNRRREYLYGPAQDHKLPIALFPRYLRLLDFKNAGTPDKEIGHYLFPPNNYSGENLRDKINKAFIAASRWRDNYLIIALHRPSSS